jgi:hypothetical protein
VPTNRDLPKEELDRDPDAEPCRRPLTDEDRRLRAPREREKWISAISVSPPGESEQR